MLDDGLHDSLLAAALDGLSEADFRRFGREFAQASRPLVECFAASQSLSHNRAECDDPPLRWSPAARGAHRCDDHEGHLQSVYRTRAQRAQVAGDPTWTCWHALAESRRLAESVQWITRQMEDDGA